MAYLIPLPLIWAADKPPSAEADYRDMVKKHEQEKVCGRSERFFELWK